MRRVAKIIASVIATGVVVLVGTIPAGATTKNLSTNEFRRTANNICHQGRQLREELVQKYFGDLPAGADPSPEQLSSFVEEYRSLVQQQIDSLHALPAPSAMAPKMKKMLSAAKAALKRVVADPTLLTGSTNPFATVIQRARAAGLKECAA